MADDLCLQSCCSAAVIPSKNAENTRSPWKMSMTRFDPLRGYEAGEGTGAAEGRGAGAHGLGGVRFGGKRLDKTIDVKIEARVAFIIHTENSIMLVKPINLPKESRS